MSFRRERTKDYFLLDTNVENMFINEYMASAPEGYVKVYLFALMYTDLNVPFSNEDIAKHLTMDIEDVLKAWTYWEKMGVIRKIKTPGAGSLEYDVEFVLLKNMLYGNHEQVLSAEADHGISTQMANKEFRDMFDFIEKAVGRVISGSEMSEVLSWINDYSIDPEMVAFAFEYCARKKKKTIKYVGAVVRNWVSEGYRTTEAIKEHFEQLESQSANYRRVFQALGFRYRNPTEEEVRIMNNWFGKMNLSMEQVLEACSKTAGIPNPSINYVNKILENAHSSGAAAASGGISTSDIMRYYDLLRQREEREAEQRKAEVYSKVPRIKEIADEENSLGSQLSRIVVSDRIDKKETVEKIKETIEMLSAERAFLLTDNGFELDHMDVQYRCPDCKDTGMLETGERCQCFGEITAEMINRLEKTEQR